MSKDKKTIYVFDIEAIKNEIEILEMTHACDKVGVLKSEINKTSQYRYRGYHFHLQMINISIQDGRITAVDDDALSKPDQDSLINYVYVSDRHGSRISQLLDEDTRNISYQIPFISTSEFKKISEEKNWHSDPFIKPHEEIHNKSLDEEFKFRIGGLAIALTAITVMLPSFQRWIFTFIPPALIFIFAGIFGILLYMFRCRYRSIYGALECIFGMFLTTNFMYPIDSNTLIYIQMVGGIYIVVRGLDNLSNGPLKHKVWWNRIFPQNEK